MKEQPPTGDALGFGALRLQPSLVAAVTALGYEEPTPIQREAIPLLLEGRDLVGQAGTGTGKTAAFVLPMLDRLRQAAATKTRAARALVLVPTRELAMQVAEAVAQVRPRIAARRRAALRRRADGPADPRAAAAASTSSWRRRAARSTTCGGARSISAPSRSSCSTRPTRCSTWALPKTSTPSSPQRPRRARRRCLPRPGAAHRRPSPGGT